MELAPNRARHRRMTLIARLGIILNDGDPQPVRQIEGPLEIRPGRLHEVVQAAMGWTGIRPQEFRAGDAGGPARPGRLLRRPHARAEDNVAEGERMRCQDNPTCLRLRR